MSETAHNPITTRAAISALEADMAFFEARVALAAEYPDSLYQRAQVKTYETLGVLLRERLSELRAGRGKGAPS
jgi:hypothetical protein